MCEYGALFLCVQIQPQSHSEINQPSLKTENKDDTPFDYLREFSKKFETIPMWYKGARGNTDLWKKNLKSKISCQTPFNACLCPLTCPVDVSRPVLAWVQLCIKLPGGGQPQAQPGILWAEIHRAMPKLSPFHSWGRRVTRLTLDRAIARSL